MNPNYIISNAKTFAFSAENPTGTRAGGSRGGDCTKLNDSRRGDCDTGGHRWARNDPEHLVYRLRWTQLCDPHVLGQLRISFCGGSHFRIFRDSIRWEFCGQGWKICGAQFCKDPSGSRTRTELLLGDAFQKALPNHHGKPRWKGSGPVLYHHRLPLWVARRGRVFPCFLPSGASRSEGLLTDRYLL